MKRFLRWIGVGTGLTVLTGALLSPAVGGSKVLSVRPVSYSTEVAPILNKHCVECHRPGESAPFSLIGYENAKKWAPMMTEVTASRQMPPWKTEPVDVSFHGENRLTSGEIETIARWVKDGTIEGNRKLTPRAPTFASGWKLGQPDLILSPTKPFKLSKDGQDEYWNFVIDPKINKPTWVDGLDVKPGNRRVVHHVIVFLDERNQSGQMLRGKNVRDNAYLTFGGIGFTPSGALGGWAPGVSPRRLPDGVGYLVKPGTKFILQIHFNKSGKEEFDQTKVGVYFSKRPAKEAAKIAWLVDPFIRIPAGAREAHFKQVFPITRDVTLYWLMPHMHLLGKKMSAKAVFPDGSSKRLIDVRDWDFNWQLIYSLKKPLELPKGSQIVVDAIYDNSADNPRNPTSPPRNVSFGEGTKDEMMLLVAMIVPHRLTGRE